MQFNGAHLTQKYPPLVYLGHKHASLGCVCVCQCPATLTRSYCTLRDKGFLFIMHKPVVSCNDFTCLFVILPSCCCSPQNELALNVCSTILFLIIIFYNWVFLFLCVAKNKPICILDLFALLALIKTIQLFWKEMLSSFHMKAKETLCAYTKKHKSQPEKGEHKRWK